ncbi:MAG: LuxR C-terminal-related transcriptional regulator [Nocardioidaceae bacterium]|nr:LuxR C-terminal-related transcriptional regulator [Nocardioidaceae bacterium]
MSEHLRVVKDSVADPLEAELAILTAREHDVLSGIVKGWSNQQIAEELFLSINSVKTYIRTAYRKIEVTSRTHALLWGVRHGLLEGVQPVPDESQTAASSAHAVDRVAQSPCASLPDRWAGRSG